MREKINILMSGGSGLLGSHLLNINPNIIAPQRSEMNVEDKHSVDTYIKKHNPNIFLHCAAFTSPPKCDEFPQKALDVNMLGTINVVHACIENNVKLIYISTDYVFKGDTGMYKEDDELLPQNRYSWSKLGGECAVRVMGENYLIIRTTFSDVPFPYEKAFVDQYTSRDSVVKIANIINNVILDNTIEGVLHVGTERKTVKDLAILLGKKDVKDLKRDEVAFTVPHDTSFDLSKLKKYEKK